jgi:uncharacterized protein YecT (DUF1311 family)
MDKLQVISVDSSDGSGLRYWKRSTFCGVLSTLMMAICLDTGTAQIVAPFSSKVTTPHLRAFDLCVANAADQAARHTCEEPLFELCYQGNELRGNTMAMTQCTMEVNAAWDFVLNKTYQSVVGQKTGAARTAIVAAQRLWLQSRKADCDALYQANIEGSIRSVVYASCMNTTTRERVGWLVDIDQF